MDNKSIQESIIYQDKSFIIANKPATISAQEDLSKDKSFHKMLEEFASTSLFVVHRLDRPTSGVMVFAKKKKAAAHYNKLSNASKIEKVYLAAVKDPPEKGEGEIEHFLVHDSKQRKSVVSNKGDKDAKLARLSFKIVDKIENYTLIEIKLATGRFHQIRAQLAAIGSPIKGDVKYGARRANKDRSINLHASGLSFPLFYGEEQISVSAAVPRDPVWSAFSQSTPQITENKFEKWMIKK